MSKFKKIRPEDTIAAEAKRARNRNLLRVMCAVLVLAVTVTAVVYFVPRKNGSFGLEQTRAYFEVRSFFKALASDDWDGAAEKVWFFDDAENIGNGTELSEEDAEKVWKKRVEEQKNGEYANYLVDFSELKVYKKDGELYADVRLHLRERGVATYRKTTVRLNDGGIYTVADYPPEQLNSLESALSGYVGDR